MSYYSEKLQQVLSDPLQRKAYETEDSTVVIAGPGSGKTTILTLKILKLLSTHIKEPQGLACITFSREAAREFEDRLKLLGYTKRMNVFLGTVHSFCMSEILGKFAPLYNYGLPKELKILPEKIKKEIYAQVLKYFNIKKFNIIEMNKERSLNIHGNSQVTVQSNPLAQKIAVEYEKRIFEAGYIDYESIIIYSTRLIQEHDYVRKCLCARFPWLVIDEYQDLGRPLHEMVLSLFSGTNIKIFAVGDPDQSIYGFSGAKPDYLMELYNREDIIPVELKNNYRSNQQIVDGSELVLNISRNYCAKTRKGEPAVYKFITCEKGYEDQFKYFIQYIVPECIKKRIPLEEIAVLLGTQNDCRSLAAECLSNNISYYIPKHKFDRTDFVQWMEKCALWINDKRSASFEELFEFWYNMQIIHRERKFMNENEIIELKKGLLSTLYLSEEKKESLKDWILFFLKEIKAQELLRNSEQFPDELDNLNKLYEEVSDERYKEYDTNKFSKLGKPENQLTITTRHSSKGLEFEVVVMMGMDEEHFPSWKIKNDPKTLDEENRICFVCISRAKRVCILMHSTYYEEMNYYYGEVRTKRYQPSRYIKQLKEKYDS